MSDIASSLVLRFDGVRLSLPDQPGGGVAVDLALNAGELALVQAGDEQHEQALADVACGLVAPERGAVRFLGRAWSELPADQDRTVRWVAGVSTAATAKAVAVLAMASRVYAEHDDAFAARCALEARRGWACRPPRPSRSW